MDPKSWIHQQRLSISHSYQMHLLYEYIFSNILMLSVKNVFPTWVLMRKIHFGVIELYFRVLFEGEHCGHYTSRVNVGNAWFLISDIRVLR